MAILCDDTELQPLIEAMRADPSGQIARLNNLTVKYPEDARLFFLLGSALIGEGRMIEGHGALKRAVDIAPDFAVARYQLGFFQLTSGEAANALDTWGRLDLLPDGHYLRKFVDGLRCLIRDDFKGAIASMRQGMALNQENPPMNNDIQLLIDRCEPLADKQRDDGEQTSEAALLLSQFSSGARRN